MHRIGLWKSSWISMCAKAVTIMVLVYLPLFFAGCGGGGDESIVDPTNNTIGPGGGTVTDDGGASVTIPPGALTGEVKITVNTLPKKDDLPEENQTFLPLLGGAEFGPAGTAFDIPAVITIPVDPPLDPGEEAAVFFWDETEEAWKEVEGNVTVAPDGGSVSAEVTHFSLFSAVTDVFDDFQANFGDGSTAESAFTSYVSWFRANVTDLGRKGTLGGDCHEVVGLRIGLSYDVIYYPDGPHYQGIPYVMYGESTDNDVIFYVAYEFVQAGVVDKNYNLQVNVFLECCAPEVTVSAEPANIGTTETSQVTATVMCDDEAMEGHQVTFESLGGLGTLSPSTAAVSAGGTAVSTFTAGDDEGTESVRASLTTCKGQETPDGAAQIEIGNDWTADMNITFNLNEGDEPLYDFTDNVSISLNLSMEEGVVTGTGTGSHNIDLSIAGNCSEQDMYAPSFSVIVTGAQTGDNLEFMVIAMSIPLSFTLHCVWDGVEDDFPYPIFGLLESSIMAQYIHVMIPLENGATDSGSGSDPAGGDNPMTWNYTVTLSGS
jgi:hypothetical protein